MVCAVVILAYRRCISTKFTKINMYSPAFTSILEDVRNGSVCRSHMSLDVTEFTLQAFSTKIVAPVLLIYTRNDVSLTYMAKRQLSLSFRHQLPCKMKPFLHGGGSVRPTQLKVLLLFVGDTAPLNILIHKSSFLKVWCPSANKLKLLKSKTNPDLMYDCHNGD